MRDKLTGTLSSDT
jgi:hypothetical protein